MGQPTHQPAAGVSLPGQGLNAGSRRDLLASGHPPLCADGLLDHGYGEAQCRQAPEGPCRADLVGLMARGNLSCGVTVRDNDGTGQLFLLLPAISPDLAVAATSASMFWVRGEFC